MATTMKFYPVKVKVRVARMNNLEVVQTAFCPPSRRRILAKRTPLTKGTAVNSSASRFTSNLKFFFLSRNDIPRNPEISPSLTKTSIARVPVCDL